MIEFYAEIRFVHVTAVLASGGLFLLRGLAMIRGAGWANAAILRYLAYSIDTVLLTAAMMLMTIVQQYPGVHGWLTVKVVLLVVYIALAVNALSVRQPSRGRRIGYWLAALLVYAFIISVAQARHPLGIFS